MIDYQPGDRISAKPLPNLPASEAVVIADQGRTLWVRFDDGRKLNISKSDVMITAQPTCYHPQLSHAACPAGHPVHLDVDHYDEPTWVHCLIRDVVACPHDYEDITGAALPGKHRATR